MDISLIRVDDRLIHGQVVMGWTQALGIQQILVADDETAADAGQKSLLMLAVPSGVVADVLPIDYAAEVVANSASDIKTLVLVKGPLELLELYRAGMPMSVVNFGNVHTGPGRKKLTKEVHATDEEIAAMKELSDAGVVLEAQWLPGTSKTDLKKVLGEVE